MPVDTSAWPTKDEARQELGGLSLSQLNNLIKAKRLEVRMRKRPNQPPIGVINPDDLDREKALRSQVRPHVMPPAEASASPTSSERASEFATAFAAALSDHLQRALPAPAATEPAVQAVQLEHLDVLSIKQASILKGYPVKFLRNLANEGRLHTFKLAGRRGRLMFREDLDRVKDLLPRGSV